MNVHADISYYSKNAVSNELDIYLGRCWIRNGESDKMEFMNYRFDNGNPLVIDIVHAYEIVRVFSFSASKISLSLLPDSVKELYLYANVGVVGEFPSSIESLSVCVINHECQVLPAGLKSLIVSIISEECRLPDLEKLVCGVTPRILPESLTHLSCSLLNNVDQNLQVLSNLKSLIYHSPLPMVSFDNLEFIGIPYQMPVLSKKGELEKMCPNLKKLSMSTAKFHHGDDYSVWCRMFNIGDIFDVSTGISSTEHNIRPSETINFDGIPRAIVELYIHRSVDMSNFDPRNFPELEKVHCSFNMNIINRLSHSSIKTLVLDIELESEFWKNEKDIKTFVRSVSELDCLSLPGLSDLLFQEFIETKTFITRMFLGYQPNQDTWLLPFDVIIAATAMTGKYLINLQHTLSLEMLLGIRNDIPELAHDQPRFHSSGPIAVIVGRRSMSILENNHGKSIISYDQCSRTGNEKHGISYTLVSREKIENPFGSLIEVFNLLVPDEYIAPYNKSARK